MTSTHASFHFFLGAAVGMAVLVPGVWSAARDRRPLAKPILRWLLAAYAVGFWAVVPNILGHLGVPHGICDACWMNIFLLHPLIDSLQDGGKLLGEIGMTMIFCAQYVVIVTACIQPPRKSVATEIQAFAAGTPPDDPSTSETGS